MQRRLLVESDHHRPGVLQVLEGEQISRRLLSCGRAGNLGLPVSRRRERSERQDCRWRHRIQQGGVRLPLDRSFRRRTGARHFLDGQLFRQRRAGPRHAGDQGKGPAGRHGIGPATGALDRRIRIDAEAAARRPPRSQTDDDDALEPARTADPKRRRSRLRRCHSPSSSRGIRRLASGEMGTASPYPLGIDHSEAGRPPRRRLGDRAIGMFLNAGFSRILR